MAQPTNNSIPPQTIEDDLYQIESGFMWLLAPALIEPDAPKTKRRERRPWEPVYREYKVSIPVAFRILSAAAGEAIR
jgi:hypothetical protein